MTENDRDADADDRRSPTTCHPACRLVLFGEIGWAGWLSWFVNCFLFSYLLPTDMDVAASMNSFVPLSRLMAEQIAGLKQWSLGRARPSTSTPATSERKLRKLGV